MISPPLLISICVLLPSVVESQQGPLPDIVTQPTDVQVAHGDTAKFTVFASGDGLTYQWFGPGEVALSDSAGEIEGATTATLRILNVQPGDAGDYRVRIENTGGSVTSDLANINIVQRLTCQLPASVSDSYDVKYGDCWLFTNDTCKMELINNGLLLSNGCPEDENNYTCVFNDTITEDACCCYDNVVTDICIHPQTPSTSPPSEGSVSPDPETSNPGGVTTSHESNLVAKILGGIFGSLISLVIIGIIVITAIIIVLYRFKRRIVRTIAGIINWVGCGATDDGGGQRQISLDMNRLASYNTANGPPSQGEPDLQGAPVGVKTKGPRGAGATPFLSQSKGFRRSLPKVLETVQKQPSTPTPVSDTGLSGPPPIRMDSQEAESDVEDEDAPLIPATSFALEKSGAISGAPSASSTTRQRKTRRTKVRKTQKSGVAQDTQDPGDKGSVSDDRGASHEPLPLEPTSILSPFKELAEQKLVEPVCVHLNGEAEDWYTSPEEGVMHSTSKVVQESDADTKESCLLVNGSTVPVGVHSYLTASKQPVERAMFIPGTTKEGPTATVNISTAVPPSDAKGIVFGIQAVSSDTLSTNLILPGPLHHGVKGEFVGPSYKGDVFNLENDDLKLEDVKLGHNEIIYSSLAVKESRFRKNVVLQPMRIACHEGSYYLQTGVFGAALLLAMFALKQPTSKRALAKVLKQQSGTDSHYVIWQLQKGLGCRIIFMYYC